MAARIALLILLLAGAAHAQVEGITVTTVPATPLANTPVRIVVTTECGCPAHMTPIVRDGFTFDVPYNPLCLGVCMPTDVATYDVGPLPAGTYTVQHFPEDEPSAAREVIGTFQVYAPVEGVTVTTEPAVPNVNTPVTLIVSSECGCPSEYPLVRDGFVIDVPFGPYCLSACLPTVERFDLGILAPGVYTVRSFPGGSPEEAVPIGAFAVVNGAVPALDWRGLAAMAAALLTAGFFALRR